MGYEYQTGTLKKFLTGLQRDRKGVQVWGQNINKPSLPPTHSPSIKEALSNPCIPKPDSEKTHCPERRNKDACRMHWFVKSSVSPKQTIPRARIPATDVESCHVPVLRCQRLSVASRVESTPQAGATRLSFI